MIIFCFVFSSIGVRIGDDLQLQVAVRKRRESLEETSMDDDSSAERLKGVQYEPIQLDDYCGISTLHKFEMFIANLIHEEKHQQ